MSSESRKTVRKSFRITEEEESVFRSQCERYGMTDSAYFRYMLTRVNDTKQEEMRSKEEYLAIKELINEINHIGININQIVRNVNMKFYSDSEKKKLFALMKEVKQKVMGL